METSLRVLRSVQPGGRGCWRASPQRDKPARAHRGDTQERVRRVAHSRVEALAAGDNLVLKPG